MLAHDAEDSGVPSVPQVMSSIGRPLMPSAWALMRSAAIFAPSVSSGIAVAPVSVLT